MKTIFGGSWNLMRIIRLVLGITIIIQGVTTAQWLFVILGALFTLMPLFNLGCCGGSACNTKSPKQYQSKEPEDIHYEEIP